MLALRVLLLLCAAPCGAADLEAARKALDLARASEEQGESARAHEQRGEALRLVTADAEWKDDPAAIELLVDVGRAAANAEDWQQSFDATQPALEVREAKLEGDDPLLQAARSNVANAYFRLGRDEEAIALFEKVLEVRERTLPPDAPALLGTRINLGLVLAQKERLADASVLFERALGTCRRTLEESNPLRIKLECNYAQLQSLRDELVSARELGEAALAGLEGHADPGDPLFIRVLAIHARTLCEDGDLTRAIELATRAVSAAEDAHAENAPLVALARSTLAYALERAGRLDRAAPLYEQAIASLESADGASRVDALPSRVGLARVTFGSGDVSGARILLESAIDAMVATGVQAGVLEDAKLLLVDVLWRSDECARAIEVARDVSHAIDSRIGRDTRYARLARVKLAQIEIACGETVDLETAAKDFEAAARSCHDDDPLRLVLAGLRAECLVELGHVAEGLAIDRAVLSDAGRLLPVGDAVRVDVARAAAAEAVQAREPTLAAELFQTLEQEIVAALDRGRTASARERSELAARLEECEATVLSFAASSESSSAALGFDVVETIRAHAVASGITTPGASDPAVAELVRRARDVRASLASLMVAPEPTPDAVAQRRARIASLTQRRDETERELRARTGSVDVALRVEAAALARALPDKSCAIAYRRYGRFALDESSRELVKHGSHVLAHVVDPSGHVARIELGPEEPIAAAVADWRKAVERGARDGERGLAVESAKDDTAGDEHAAALRLRTLVLDPVLAAVGEARVLHVCADADLLLVPLDAVLATTGSADRFVVRNEISFARLLHPSPPRTGENGLVVLGGVDYDADPNAPPVAAAASSSSPPHESHDGAPAAVAATSAPAGPKIAATTRPATTRSARGSGATWSALPGTSSEVDAIAAEFHERFEVDAHVLRGAGATKAALATAVPGARYVHLATHGYFAPDAAPRNRDAAREIDSLAPLLRCGLVLAGANTGRDALGDAPGILTGEELAGLDFSHCDLAVLSACETSLGIHWLGQRLQSLQSALHAAGARTTITSLWKVDDEATRALFAEFYRRIWTEHESKADALWHAKSKLRASGVPTRGWAGWVLTGDP